MSRKSRIDRDGKFNRTPKRVSWIKFQRECEWCGDEFCFFSSINDAGDGPKYPVRFCSPSCVSSARWEGRSVKINKWELQRLYFAGLSGPQLASHFGVYRHKIYDLLKELGIPRRRHTSVRTCIEPGCKEPAQKQFHHRRDSQGMRILFGRRCAKHRKQAQNAWNRKRKRELDPLIGKRKIGAKGIPCSCPVCKTEWPTTRKAMACHKLDWRQFKRAMTSAGKGEPRAIDSEHLFSP